MPWPMSHLYIAQNTFNFIPIEGKDISQYYLGTIAPDAIHFRQNYIRVQKAATHLYNDILEYNDENFSKKWKTNIEIFYNKYKSLINISFLLGYCIHLIADVYYYDYIYKPFELKLIENKEIEYKEIYSKENLDIDLEIFQKSDYGKSLFPIIKEMKTFNFSDLILKTDMDRIKNNIVNIQYSNKPLINTINNKHIKINEIMIHNNNIINYIKEEFLEKYVKKKNCT